MFLFRRRGEQKTQGIYTGLNISTGPRLRDRIGHLQPLGMSCNLGPVQLRISLINFILIATENY